MKHRLLSWLGLGLAWLSAGPALASFHQGAQLTYRPLGNNRYRVTYQMHHDCNVIAAAVFANLVAQAGPCGTSSPLDFTLGMTRTNVVIGTPYCPTAGNLCGSTSLANTEVLVYEADVTLPPAQWTLSVLQNGSRTAVGNLTLPITPQRVEATLDNRSGLQNTSPTFATRPLGFVAAGQEASLNMGAYDADGDSLVFSSVAPQQACGQPNAYTPVDPLGIFELHGTSSCYMALAGRPDFSAALPVPSFTAQGVCPVVNGVPYFDFNPASGAVQFKPVMLRTSPNASVHPNWYTVVSQVEEWRRLGGRYVKVGSAQYEQLVQVYDPAGNVMPRLGSTVRVQHSGSGVTTTQPLTQVIPVRAGQQVEVEVTGTDANAQDVPTFSFNDTGVPGVRVFASNRNSAIFFFQPPSTMPSGLYYITATVWDNACPVRGWETRTLAFRVSGNVLSQRQRAAAAGVTAFPNPFEQQTTVAFGHLTPQQRYEVIIRNQLGQVVAQLPAQADAAGEARVSWAPPARVPAGVYLAQLPGQSQQVRLLRR
jgi:hypothetical protein